MGNPYPSTGDVAYTVNETVAAEDVAWTPSHVRGHEAVATTDALRAERITFLRTQHEDLTAVSAVDRLALLVGHTPTEEKPSPGWDVREFKKTLHEDLSPGQSWTFIVEDYFDYRTLCDGTLWIQNTQAQTVHATVVEYVAIDGRLDSFTLFEGTLSGKCIQPVGLLQPLTLPTRMVYHEVTIRNDEPTEDAFVIVMIAGWVGHSTYLPAELPHVYGEGIQ